MGLKGTTEAPLKWEPAAAVVGQWRGMERSAGGGQAIGLRRGPHAGWVQGSARLRRPCGDRAITHLSELAPIPKRPRRR